MVWTMPVLDVQRLRVFRAVVASGTVQAAATHLGYSPSAVSQQITALQKETGLALFEKSGRGIAPTAAGRLLATRSEEVMDSLSRLGGLVDDLRDGRTGNLSIGTFASAGETWIPLVARTLTTEFPDVMLTLGLNEYPGTAKQGYDIDLRTEDTDDEPTTLPGYRRHVLLEEPYALILAADHPLAAGDEVSVASLEGQRWIDDDFQDTTCGRILAKAWRAAGFTPRYVARASDHHAAIAFAAAGVGMTAIPRLAVGVLPPGARALTIVDPTPTRRIVAFVREGSDANPAVARAVAVLHEVAHGRRTAS
jgi:DNA-binding transcriptional LysR family regulator